MSKPIPKNKTQIRVSGKGAGKPREENRLWIGVDLSLHTMAMAGLAYDGVTRKFKGPAFSVTRWNKNDHYLDRLKETSKGWELIVDICADVKLLVEPDQIFIAQEEPWPFGMTGKGNSSALKQQAEMSGALLSGLMRFNYTNIYQINCKKWQKMVADDLGITTHYSSWGKGVVGKMRSKEWALENRNGKHWKFPNGIPIWPDLINDAKNGGRMPKPETSKAQPLQPDDRYDALAIATWAFVNLRPEGFDKLS